MVISVFIHNQINTDITTEMEVIIILVRLGVTPQNVGWNNSNSIQTEEELALQFLTAKFKYIVKEADIIHINGFSHIRLPNIVPKCSVDTLTKVLKSQDLEYYKKILSNQKISFSYHVSYGCNDVSYRNLQFLIDYYTKLYLVQKFLGIEAMHCTTHINKNSYNEIKNVFKSLSYNTSKLIVDEICIENCEHGLNFEECLDLSYLIQKPVIFDNLHNRINGNYTLNSINIERLQNRWSSSFLVPKMHYSNGDSRGKHNSVLDIEEFINILVNLKYSFSELLVLFELQYSQNIISRLKYMRYDLDWNDDYSFHI